MSTAPVDYKHLLTEAISKAKEKAPRATDDLLRFASGAAEAVDSVTGGAAALEVVPINQGERATPIYQLQLRKVGSESPPSDLGVYCLSAAGYPVLRWYSRRNWEDHPDSADATFHNGGELEGNFRWMVSSPESRLVILVSFFQQNIPPSRISTAGPT
jgi:hypothetical protein